MPKKEFFPPKIETVDKTMDFVPENNPGSNRYVTSICHVPGGKTFPEFIPQSFRKVGKPAVRIQTWNRVRVEMSGKFSFVYPSFHCGKTRQKGGGITRLELNVGWSKYPDLLNFSVSDGQAMASVEN
jgi:hypothetical protein